MENLGQAQKRNSDQYALLIVAEWDEFKKLDMKKIKGLMANPIILDGRNIYEPSQIRELGFEYYSIGRK